MLFKKLRTCTLVLSIASSAAMAVFEKGDRCKVIAGPQKGETAIIEGDSQAVWGIKDVWMSPLNSSLPTLMNYIMSKPPRSGTVYYGEIRTPTMSSGFYFHESWLKKISN